MSRNARWQEQAADTGPATLEQLEPRLLLDGTPGGEAIELFDLSPALFVENQGQWADQSIRYGFHGDGANVLFTERGRPRPQSAASGSTYLARANAG